MPRPQPQPQPHHLRTLFLACLAAVGVAFTLKWALKLLHVLTAGHWYESAIFWAAAGVVAVLLIGGLTILAQFVAGKPGLTYGMQSQTSKYTFEELAVLHVDHPQILLVCLDNPKRVDVASKAFDQDKPLILDVGVPILSLETKFAVQSESLESLADPPAVAVTVDGTALKVGPCLIRKRLRLRFVVSANGATPRLTCQSPLVNVPVRRQRRTKLP